MPVLTPTQPSPGAAGLSSGWGQAGATPCPLGCCGGGIAARILQDWRGSWQKCVQGRCQPGTGSKRQPPRPHVAGTRAGTCGWGWWVHRGPTGRSVATGFSPRSLLPPGSRSTSKHCCPHRPCLFPSPACKKHCGAPCFPVLCRHPPGVTLPAESGTALGELGALRVPSGLPAYAQLLGAVCCGVQGSGFGVLWGAVITPKPFPGLGTAAITQGTLFPSPLGC